MLYAPEGLFFHEVRKGWMLRPGYDFIRCAGQNKLHAVVGVGRDGCGKVQCCEVDGFGPVTVGVVVAAGVKFSGGDGVIADAFRVAVAENQNCRLQILSGADWLVGRGADFYWRARRLREGRVAVGRACDWRLLIVGCG